MTILYQTAAAAVGTVAFALLYGVPARFFLSCGLVGGAGWLLYALLTAYGWSDVLSVFAATLVVTFLSRKLSVRERCPATVFLTTGIFPLVPGVGVYWTTYYIVTNQLPEALQSGLSAMKAAIGIVLGITMMFEVPNRWFHSGASSGRRIFK